MTGFFKILLTGCTAALLLLAGCSRKDFLDENPDTDLFIPKTLKDFRALLDNELLMQETPAMGEVSSDNFYLEDYNWNFLAPKERNTYLWSDIIYGAGEGNIEDWNIPYQQVFHANVVLDGLLNIPVTSSNQKDWNTIKGNALFLRAYAFFNVAQVFAPVYNAATAHQDLGIPLRLKPDPKEVSTRATVAASYQQIIADLQEAASLLPDPIDSLNRNRPTKPAALALLSRVFLSMSNYDQALEYADQCLQLYNALIDYNTADPSLPLPFTRLNIETLYQSRLLSNSSIFANRYAIVDSGLYKSYADNDLRKMIFFSINVDNQPVLKGSYSGTYLSFTGMATDEIYLIKAECHARKGSAEMAMNVLNTLLDKRWRTGTFIPIEASSPAEALQIILTERRKELPFRGIRWSDLRRLNEEGANITLKRILNGNEYILLPGSKKYVLPIPPDVIRLTGMEQNER